MAFSKQLVRATFCTSVHNGYLYRIAHRNKLWITYCYTPKVQPPPPPHTHTHTHTNWMVRFLLQENETHFVSSHIDLCWQLFAPCMESFMLVAKQLIHIRKWRFDSAEEGVPCTRKLARKTSILTGPFLPKCFLNVRNKMPWRFLK
jgi:hypothetical protein